MEIWSSIKYTNQQEGIASATLEQCLRQGGVGETAILSILQEVTAGNVAALAEYGIEVQVDDEMPPSTTDSVATGEVLNTLTEKFENFSLLEVLYALHEAGEELRKASREMRHAERDMAQTEAKAAAANIRRAALVNMVFGIVTGVATIGTSIGGCIALGGAAKSGNEALRAMTTKVDALNSAVGGGAQTLKGVGEFVASLFTAKQTEHQAASQKAASMESEFADFQKSAEELMNSVRTIVKEALQAYNQTNASIYRNM